MNTRRDKRFKLRRMKRVFKRSPRLMERYGAFKDLVGQVSSTFHALRRRMDADGDAPLWATRRHYLRRSKQADRARRKATEARRLRTTAESRRKA